VKLSLDATPTRTTCPYCGVGCGVLAAQGKDGAVEVAGDPDHPANFGRLCSKGAALGETVGSEGRLTEPMVDGAPTNWPAALDRVATGFARAIADYGPDSVAFYVSGQMLTEDYYVINKLAKGFLGTANIDTNSRLCMASSVAGHKRAFGGDIVPGCYEDLDEADLLVLVGSNAAWCHPVLYQRMAAAKAARPSLRVVVIDPRRTDTCDLADLHLSLRPGSDAVLFNGLLSHLSKSGAAEATFVALHTKGADETLAAVNRQTPERTAEICGLAEGAVHLFFDWFAKTQKVVTLYSQGINQSSSGVDKVNSIINCHLLTGRIGRPGMGPFSLTGQPNAMGGREVGGLANQLAAHMEIDNPQHRDSVQRFWRSPAMASKPGLKAVDMFEAIGKGRIKAIWIMATNPLVSLPDVNGARAALEACPLVVVSDCMRHTDTTRVAHVLLPATTWGEKDGTVTNCERRISRQRRFLRAPGMARDDWRIVCDVAIRMGFAGFGYDSAAAIFREHAALSGFENDGSRGFDISSLSDVSGNRYDSLAPLQWPAPPRKSGGRQAAVRVGPLLCARWQSPHGSDFTPRAASPDNPSLSARSEQRQGARSLAYDDAHWKISPVVNARVRTLRRTASRRRASDRTGRWRLGETEERSRIHDCPRAGLVGAAPRLRVCADALEQRICRKGPAQLTRLPCGRSHLGSARIEACANCRRALYRAMARLCSNPTENSAATRRILGGGSRQ
jgi:assimilatory nitrate reductase catalytic subunit